MTIIDFPTGQSRLVTQQNHACGDRDQPPTSRPSMPHAPTSAAPDLPHAAMLNATPFDKPLRAGQTPTPANDRATSIPARAIADATPTGASPELVSPLLGVAAEIVDDFEKVRVANENRLRQLTRGGPDDERIAGGKFASVDELPPDKDGDERGFGYPLAKVKPVADLVVLQIELEKKAVHALQKMMKASPLGPFVTGTKGLGLKQTARLLATIGDPYIRPEMIREDGTVEPSRPRTVSELWAYCGLHVVPTDHGDIAAQAGGGDSSRSGPGQESSDTHQSRGGVAPKRQRGQRSNWNEDARKRAWLISKSVVKAGGPYREIYDATKAKYADAVHTVVCVRCGPKGKPARAGSPLSKGHIDARGLRAISKAVLRDLWRESQRLHELPGGQTLRATQTGSAAGGERNGQEDM